MHIYALIYSDEMKLLLFKKLERSSWREGRYIMRPFKKDHDSFFVANTNRPGQTNTIYLNGGYINSPLPGLLVFPGGKQEGDKSHVFTELFEEVGFSKEIMKNYPSMHQKFRNYSITYIKVQKHELEALEQEANKNFQLCNIYRDSLLQCASRGINEAKQFVNNNRPPLIDDELGECRIDTFENALRYFQTDTERLGWFEEGLQFLINKGI